MHPEDGMKNVLIIFGLGVATAGCDMQPSSSRRSGNEPDYTLELKGWNQTIQVGENAQFELLIHGTRVVDLLTPPPPYNPDSREWSKDAVFHVNVGYEPKSPGIKNVGPFALQFQGKRLESNITTVEVTEAWKPAEERYEFRVFPKTVQKGSEVRVYFRQQYSTKAFMDIVQRNPRDQKGTGWTSIGATSWEVGDVRFSRELFFFAVTPGRTGAVTLTRRDLPALPAVIDFAPIELSVY